jgi:hypothetical protein
MNGEMEKMTHKISELWLFADKLKLNNGNHEIKLEELRIRLDSTESKIVKLD